MEILGIGPSELIFVIIIALIVLGPKDMQKAGKSIGSFLNKLVKSDGWKAFQQTSRELRNLPTNLMREANMDLAETEKEIRSSMKTPVFPGMSLPTNPTSPVGLRAGLSLPQGTENSIQPPSATNTPADESPSVSKSTLNTPDSDPSTPNQNA
jgi:Sec-independent protein translocase protein TatA